MFTSRLLHADRNLIVLEHVLHPSRPFRYAGEEVIGDGYTGVWFLFKDQPFDIGRFYRPDGLWTGYYIDVLEPVHWEGDDPLSLNPLVDLFLDLWIAPDGSYAVLDEDEFETAVEAGVITDAQAEAARSTLQGLLLRVQEGIFPPDSVRRFEPSGRMED